MDVGVGVYVDDDVIDGILFFELGDGDFGGGVWFVEVDVEDMVLCFFGVCVNRGEVIYDVGVVD